MSAPHRQPGPVPHEGGAGYQPLAEQLRPDHESGDTPRQMTWQEHQAAGDEAWGEALERTRALRPEAEDDEDPAPLDEGTIELYERASRHLKAVIFLGPDGPTDPFTLLKLGGSQAALAEATPVGVFYEDGGGHLDVQSNLQESSTKNLQRAAAMLMGEKYQPTQELADKVADVNPSEVMAEAAVEAANEAGTGEHVAATYVARADEVTPEVLEAEGIKGMERYISEHGEAPDSGPEFLLRLSTKAVEQLTGEHELPADTARGELVRA